MCNTCNRETKAQNCMRNHRTKGPDGRESVGQMYRKCKTCMNTVKTCKRDGDEDQEDEESSNMVWGDLRTASDWPRIYANEIF